MGGRLNCVAEFVASGIISQENGWEDRRANIVREVERELVKLVERSTEGLVVTGEEASAYIPGILAGYDRALRFALIPFKEIPYQMYDSVLENLFAAQSTVGAGITASGIFEGAGEELHVVHITGRKREVVRLADKGFPGGESIVDWFLFEGLVLGADSGYWVVGREEHWRAEWI